ncbi:MAG: riboflavin synthase [Phycisphaerae bacterium]
MFTGIIQHVGSIRSTAPSGAGRVLSIDLGPLAASLAKGDSLAVDGACLTLNAPAAGRVGQFDVVHETLDRTTLGRLGCGDRVNLELALRSGQGFDGHVVQGHVDGLARVESIDKAGGRWEAHFAAAAELVDQMVPKGSVAIAGVSLTLASVRAESFSTALIPTTLAGTTLADLSVGQEVNLETDVLGKYVRRYLQQMLGPREDSAAPSRRGVSLEDLRRTGFA